MHAEDSDRLAFSFCCYLRGGIFVGPGFEGCEGRAQGSSLFGYPVVDFRREAVPFFPDDESAGFQLFQMV